MEPGVNILPQNEKLFPDGFSETINSSPVKKGFLKLDKFTCLFSISLLYLGSVPIRHRNSKVFLVGEGVGEHVILELHPDFLQDMTAENLALV